MTVIATASNPRFRVSRVDIDRAGPTYTGTRCGTCRRLNGRTRSCSSSPGRTRWPTILSWKEPEELFALAHFIGVTRPGYQLSDPQLPGGR